MNQQYFYIKDKMHELGRKLVGVVELGYPTYMVHLDFMKPNDDPMYQIDWAIMHFVKDMPCVNIPSVARIIGMEESLIEYRIRTLCETNNLKYVPKSGEYIVTIEGENNYFSSEDSVMYVNSSKDLLVDGHTLKIMDGKIYTARARVESGNKSDTVESATVSKDCRQIKDLLSKLELMTNTNKEKLLIPSDSKDFSTSDEPTFGSIKLYFVFSVDNNGTVFKDVMFNDQIVKVPYYSDKKEKCYFEGYAKFNYGFTNLAIGDTKNRIFDFNSSNIFRILNSLYGWKNIDDTYFTYLTSNYHGQRPLTVNINIDNFKKSLYIRDLIKDLKRGYVEYIPNPKRPDTFIVISVISTDRQVKDIITFDEKVDLLYKTSDKNQLMNFLKESNYIQSRKDLILLGRYDVLESIDILSYIKSI